MPVYNVASYLEDCINSIVTQFCNDIFCEIICVDDGSTDDSLYVIKKLQKRIPQIKIYENVTNKGVSYSRNLAIRNAKGKYIWFVDPDDMLCPEVVKIMYCFAEQNNADCLLGDFRRFFNTNDDLESMFCEKHTYSCIESDAPPLDANGVGMSAVWAGLFRRNFLVENHLFFNENMIAQEDTLFFWLLKLAEPKRFKCNFPCYFYRQRLDSVMHIRSNERNIKYYLSMREMLSVYRHQLLTYTNISQENKTILQHKILHSHQNIVTTLASVTDTQYVKQELKCLKKAKIYPYKFRWCLFQEQLSVLSMMNFLMPIEAVFWVRHIAYKLRSKGSG